MRNINKVILIGNVARPPEVKNTVGGQKMTTFILATNRTWHDNKGKKQSQPEFHNMLSWGKVAGICQKFLQKSTLVYIEGYLKTRSWDGEEGNRFYRTEVVVQDILVLDKGVRTQALPETSSHPKEIKTILDDDLLPEKPVQEIEKTFQSRLEKGNETQADVSSHGIADQKPPSDNTDFFLDEPLFEEES